MADKIKTRIDEAKLEEWVRKIPECEEFLENFFLSCRLEIPEINFINYVEDIRKYSQTPEESETHRAIKENYDELIRAFEDVTGLKMGYG